MPSGPRPRDAVDEAAICILKEVFCYNGSFLRSPSYRVLFGVKKESDKLTQCRNFNARNATWRRATLCSERAAHAIRRSGLTLPGAIIGVTATAKAKRTNGSGWRTDRRTDRHFEKSAASRLSKRTMAEHVRKRQGFFILYLFCSNG